MMGWPGCCARREQAVEVHVEKSNGKLSDHTYPIALTTNCLDIS